MSTRLLWILMGYLFFDMMIARSISNRVLRMKQAASVTQKNTI